MCPWWQAVIVDMCAGESHSIKDNAVHTALCAFLHTALHWQMPELELSRANHMHQHVICWLHLHDAMPCACTIDCHKHCGCCAILISCVAEARHLASVSNAHSLEGP